MSDKPAGSEWSNPIMYRNYRIYVSTHPYEVGGYDYVHEDYDPTPLYADDPPADNRCGYGKTIQDCKDQIDEREDD